MGSRVTTYSPKKVTIALGHHIVTGYADDSFITIEPGSDGTSHVTGSDGEIARSLDPASLFTMKISLLQASASNDFLKNMYDKDHEDGSGMFSVNICDILGNEKFSGAQAWVTKHAAWNRGKTTNNREWEIVVAEGYFR